MAPIRNQGICRRVEQHLEVCRRLQQIGRDQGCAQKCACPLSDQKGAHLAAHISIFGFALARDQKAQSVLGQGFFVDVRDHFVPPVPTVLDRNAYDRMGIERPIRAGVPGYQV